jgi:lipopolysaccharide/colanic/teichoic acid biosynthesis glycosyltransferase
VDLTERPCVLGECLFASALVRERKRSDRSKQRFCLLLVDVADGTPRGSSPMSDLAVAALAGVVRETDIIGWFESRAMVGVIVVEIRECDLSDAREGLEARVRRRLAERLGADGAATVPIRLHVYPEPKSAGGEGVGQVDPKFYPDLRSRRGRESRYEALKRALDLLGSVTLLVGLAPLFLLIAALVSVGSRGPVLFRQVRIGQMMKPFTMLKFRTMQSDADHRLHQEFVSSFIKAGQVQEPSKDRVFKLTADPRVTTIGRILRNTSLDELPQLWNVLRGHMSLVGPRPPLPYELEQYEPWHRGRVLEAKPGLTGLWQVVGRSRTTFDEMVRLDLQYARTRSFWTDLKILLATPGAVVSGKGAR